MRIPSNLRVQFFKEAMKNGMRVLPYDIETSHMELTSFYIGSKCSVYHNQIRSPSKVISIQYMWGQDKKAKYLEWDKVNDGTGSKAFDDSGMITEFLTTILPKADLTVTQNGDKFDFITLNERAKVLQLGILDQKPSIDILKLSRKSFRAASHKLDYRSSQQGLGGKIQMVDQDWIDIEYNNVPVSKKMAKYGCKDVEDTWKLFWKELPYYKDLPTSVEKVILSFLNIKKEHSSEVSYYKPVLKGKPYCKSCRKKRRSATDLKKLKEGRFKCNTCTKIFKG